MAQPQNSPTDFEATRARMQQLGYMEYETTVSALRANILAILAAVPLLLLVGWLVQSWWDDFSFTIDARSSGQLLLFLVVVVLAIPVHEFLHGFTWQFFCRQRWQSIKFGVLWRILTPYCHCREPLGFWAYGLGALMPFLVLGVSLAVIGILTQNLFLLLFGVINILAAGGDLILMAMALRYRDARLLDHPTKCGFVAFRKPQNPRC
ncbi:MAG TPA: DUF3267 domain-containing protein [Anaerolineaceae bacterium]|jgi:hypothetical protein|nr:DUF3267 domain-containing protein [Anaerolineaceae bacterium]